MTTNSGGYIVCEKCQTNDSSTGIYFTRRGPLCPTCFPTVYPNYSPYEEAALKWIKARDTENEIEYQI